MDLLNAKPVPEISATRVAKFWECVVKTGEDSCWKWTGAKRGDGYGVFHPDDYTRTITASRVAYYLQTGENPGIYHVLHTCDNPECVNVKHLYLGTDADNAKDRKDRKRAPSGSDHHSRRNPSAVIFGEKIHQAKLKATDVTHIRKLLGQGRSQSEIAKLYDVNPSTISNINMGDTWSRVT